MADRSLIEYYRERASEYERIYYHPEDAERRQYLARLGSEMEALFRDRRVLEVACGTGYWTEIVSRSARSIVAIDAAEETLAEAKLKQIDSTKVRFLVTDAYALDSIGGTFDAGFANFWFSHIPKSRINEFLEGFHGKLEAGSIVYFADNIYIPGVGGELVKPSDGEDSYKIRELSDGRKFKVLKNYYTAEELEVLFGNLGTEFSVSTSTYYWRVIYKLEKK